MTLVKNYDAICDTCGKSYSSFFDSPINKSRKDAILEMHRNGWKVNSKQASCQICSLNRIRSSGEKMNFLQAAQFMDKRIPVLSLVSNTTYVMSKKGLLAEGELVSFEHLTTDEVRGEWKEVRVIDIIQNFSKPCRERIKN